jgi:hypothetical protein
MASGAIPWPDTRHRSIQGILSMPGSQHNASIASQIERQSTAFSQPRLFDNRLRILTARLFPHLDNCVSIGMWIYIEQH